MLGLTMLTWSPFDNTNLLLYNKRSIFKIFMTVGALYKVCDQFCVRTGGWDWRTHGTLHSVGEYRGCSRGCIKDAQDRRLSLFETGSILGEPGADSGGESKRAEKKNGVKITFLPAIFPARLDFPRSYYLPLGFRGWTGSDCSLPTK